MSEKKPRPNCGSSCVDLENWPRLQHWLSLHCPFPHQPTTSCHSSCQQLRILFPPPPPLQATARACLLTQFFLTSCSVPSGGVSAPAPALADSGGPSSGRLRSSLGGICSCCRPPLGPRQHNCSDTAGNGKAFSRRLSRCSHTRRWSTMLPALILVAGAM